MRAVSMTVSINYSSFSPEQRFQKTVTEAGILERQLWKQELRTDSRASGDSGKKAAGAGILELHVLLTATPDTCGGRAKGGKISLCMNKDL